jgi:hypothetical protein
MKSAMSIGGGGGGNRLHHRNNEHHTKYTRQATILRKKLQEWDQILRTPRGEDFPTMLGRMDAAFNQSVNLDENIDDILEHFVYLPQKATANPQDIPFFLSTRLEAPPGTDTISSLDAQNKLLIRQDAIQQLANYENHTARLASHFEQNMVRF